MASNAGPAWMIIILQLIRRFTEYPIKRSVINATILAKGGIAIELGQAVQRSETVKKALGDAPSKEATSLT